MNRLLGIGALLLLLPAAALGAAPAGKIQGKIVGTDDGEPIGFADVLLIPADTTLRKVGGLTNADGTFLLEAAPGRYTLQIRALSYATKRVEGVVLTAGELLPFHTGLSPEAIQQEEVVVEAKALQNTENSLLNARKRSSSVSDAVSIEQVRKSPDQDAAEVLRRVTGLSVSDGKYVFVRGLGERYSSTEVDGVRLASPEQNKRVVPLDLVPAALLDNIVVQKTYTADRPGEFGGGDVQVKTKDFPGHRTFSYSVSQGFAQCVTFEERRTYASRRVDIFGFGSAQRGLPSSIDGKVLPIGTPEAIEIGKSFPNVWSTTTAKTLPNGSYSATYGDEVKVLGRPLGLVQSWSLSRSFDRQDEVQRFFQGTASTPLYDYHVSRWTESVQIGGLSALSYRLSPSHSFHLRGIYTNDADDEVRIYEGLDVNSDLFRRSTRLQYVQRTVLSGTLEGRHSLSNLLGASLDWKLGRSDARRQQPDQREYIYNRAYYFEGDTAHWLLSSRGMREWGDMRDKGWGGTISFSIPYQLGGLGKGKLTFGYDRQSKDREHFYRRLWMNAGRLANREMPPESLFAPERFGNPPDSAYVEENTFNNPDVLSVDNYRAEQRIEATYASLDLPLGRRARANLGLRVESGFQNVLNHPLFEPDVIVAEGKIDERDLLPSGSVTVSVTEAVNLRLAASRTVSRPDLNELSPTAFYEFQGGTLARGNSALRRARLENYDVRVEAFPGLGEVLAAGFFYKKLEDPIEQTLAAATTVTLLVPSNSDEGHNQGVELEARLSLGRAWKRLNRLHLNANASFIRSEVDVQQSSSKLGSEKHPLQGQADYLVNGALSYTSPGVMDVSVLLNATGRRLRALGVGSLPDIYQQAHATVDATVSFSLPRSCRLKLAARNLTDPRIQSLQEQNEVGGYRAGRSYSIALSVGS